MIQRTIAPALTTFILFCLSPGFANTQVASQKASGNYSDRMLFKQAQEALKKSNYVEERTLLESLINTHPDSHFHSLLSRPAWQHALPGVSALADPYTGVLILVTSGAKQEIQYGWGGTSLACPIVSAFWAIAKKPGYRWGRRGV